MWSKHITFMMVEIIKFLIIMCVKNGMIRRIYNIMF